MAEAIEMNGLRKRKVVLDWHCKPGTRWIFEDTEWKSPQDATPEELATCLRQNEPR